MHSVHVRHPQLYATVVACAWQLGEGLDYQRLRKFKNIMNAYSSEPE